MGSVSQFMIGLGKKYCDVVKKILSYIKVTSDVALCFRRLEFIVKGFIDSYFVGDLDKIRYTPGYAFTLTRETISWLSKLQIVITLSTR